MTQGRKLGDGLGREIELYFVGASFRAQFQDSTWERFCGRFYLRLWRQIAIQIDNPLTEYMLDRAVDHNQFFDSLCGGREYEVYREDLDPD